MRALLIILVASLHLAMASLLSAQYTPENPASAKLWTIMVYMDGDNDLEAYALEDFMEMASVGSDGNVNVVVMLDRKSGYSSAYDNWTNTRRGRVEIGNTPSASWGKSIGEVNMGDPATLEEFIVWATQSYPSEKKVLVLWNHGSGWSDTYGSLATAEYLSRSGSLPVAKKPAVQKAICTDSTSSDELTLPEIRLLLERLSAEQGISIDIFGMDACLMAMIEVVCEFRNNADIFVGSAAEEPADGWPYDLILNALQSNPLISAAELGNIIVRKYYNYYQTDATMAAIDLAGVEPMVTAVDSLADSLIADSENNPENCLNAALAMQTAVSEAVLSYAGSESFTGALGLSINFPSTGAGTDYAGHGMKFIGMTSWPAFLNNFATRASDDWVRESYSETVRFENSWQYYDIYDFAKALIDNCGVGVSISPAGGAVFYGEGGGVFSPEHKVYRLINNSVAEISWSVGNMPAWLKVVPGSGTLSGGAYVDVSFEVEYSATASLADGVYSSDIMVIDGTYGKSFVLPFKLAVGVKDSLTEQFYGSGTDNFDLSYKTLTFTPQVDGGYKTCIADAAAFAVDTDSATVVALTDDSSYQLTMPGKFLSLFGKAYDNIYIGSNGYLTYGVSDTEYDESYNTHFLYPRVSALFDDLNPARSGAKVYYEILSDSLVVTYSNILQVDGSATSSFQIRHYYDGRIQLTWLQVGTADAIVGLSAGSKPEPFLESDFSSYLLCVDSSQEPVAIDSSVSLLQGTSTEIMLAAYDDGLPSALEYIIDSLPQTGTLYAGDVVIDTVPFSLGQMRQVRYKALSSYVGSDVFQWHAYDGQYNSGPAEFLFTIVPQLNYFTQRFLPGGSDLSGVSIKFTPDGSVNYYSACQSALTVLPVDPQGGTSVFSVYSSNDERMVAVNLTDGKNVSLYGQQWNSFNICSNGYIVFGQEDVEYQFSYAGHFELPRISLFFTDLNPPKGSNVSYKQLEDQVVVSFVDVPEYSTTIKHTFQVQMFFNGEIVLSWFDVSGNSREVGVGLSAGLGVQDEFVPTDLSQTEYCMVETPVASDASYEVWANQQIAISLSALFATSYVIETLPASGSLYCGTQKIGTVPYELGDNNVVLYVADRGDATSDMFTWYALNDQHSNSFQSGSAVVELLIRQCEDVLQPQPYIPADSQSCYSANLPLQWQVSELESKSGKEYVVRTSQQVADISAKLVSDQQQEGDARISPIPLLSFVNADESKVKILVFAGYSDNSPGGELENTLNAIAEYFPDFSVTLTDSEDVLLLSRMLREYQVFLIPEQENIADEHVAELALIFSKALPAFVERGGTLIACDHNWGANKLLDQAGLLKVGPATELKDAVLDVNPDNYLAGSLADKSPIMPGAVCYADCQGKPIVSYNGSPVAVSRSLGSGQVILLGWDYYSDDTYSSIIIANAVKVAVQEFSYNVYLDKVDPPQTMVASGLEYPIYDPGLLDAGQKYYWKVEIANKCGDLVSGPAWSFTTSPGQSDFDGDCQVNLADLAIMARHWLSDQCQQSWFNCDGADMDRSGVTDLSDLEILASQWLK